MLIRTITILGLAVFAMPLPAAPADTTSADVEVGVIPRVDQFYSPTRGIGLAAEVTVRNLGWEGSLLDLYAATLTRHGEYSAFLFTADPLENSLYGVVGAMYTGSRAYRFFGAGPRSHPDDELGFGARRASVEGRLGWRPVPDLPVTVQPVARLQHAHMRWFEELDEGALGRLDDATRENVLRTIANPSNGVEIELGLIADGFDRPRYPNHGAMLQLVGRRYVGLDADPFHYWQGSVIGHGVIPITAGRTVIETRALMTITRPAGDRPVPFFALPEVGGGLVGGFSRHRLSGRDVLALSAGLRFPVLSLFGFGADGFIAGHLVNTYDDLFEQFEPRVSFERELDRDGPTAPLRPTLTLGGTIVDLDRDRAVIGGQIGVSPEGFEMAVLNFVVDLRTRQPRVR